jgi:hypothetical protein
MRNFVVAASVVVILSSGVTVTGQVAAAPTDVAPAMI